jgi:hypothetical protein
MSTMLLLTVMLAATVVDARVPRAVRRECRQTWRTCLQTGGPPILPVCPTTSTTFPIPRVTTTTGRVSDR